MLIRLASDSDEDRWNHFTSQHPQVSPYHHFAWKKTIEKAYGHQCYYLIAENTDKEIVGVLPTVSIRPPFISGKLCALPFCDLGASLTLNESIETQLINRAKDIAAQHKLPIFEYRASQIYHADSEIIEPLQKEQKVRMLLELPDSSDALLASFKPKLRSQIKKAVKNGLKVELGDNDQLIDEFYEVFSYNMKDLGSPTHSKNWFSEIRNNYKKNMVISIIKYEGRPIGAGIILLKGSIATIPWASTKRKFNRLSPNMLLYWSLLKYSADNGYKIFDFGRSSYGEGTYRFKQQWGAKPLSLKWENFHNSGPDNTSEPITNLSKKNKIRSFIESVWKKLPLAMTIAIGSKIRKYISL